jgi:hypothetical protein
MRFRTCSALVLLVLLSACATMEPSFEEMEDPSPRFANLQRAAQYPWTDDGHCVVREASNEWPILAERCFYALDHDRVRFRDVTGRCAVASAPAAAATMTMGVALCVFASPAVVTGAVIVIGTVVVAVAIKEGLDAYERRASRERARPEASNKQEPSASRKPNPKNQPEPKRRPEPFILPNPTPEEREEWRKRCLDYYARCSEFVKGDKQWRVYGERQCQSCWLLCERTGQWPAEANEKPCPGGD